MKHSPVTVTVIVTVTGRERERKRERDRERERERERERQRKRKHELGLPHHAPTSAPNSAGVRRTVNASRSLATMTLAPSAWHLATSSSEETQR
jgi:hypothetical protein